MKALFWILISSYALVLQAEDYKCRKLDPKAYAQDMVKTEIGKRDCFFRTGTGSVNESWDIKLVLDRKGKSGSYEDGIKRECSSELEDQDNRSMLMRCRDGFDLVFVRHCSDPDQFFGVTRHTAGVVYGNGRIEASYLVECRPSKI